MGMVFELTRKFTALGKVKHYLFECPTFWRIRPAFKCPNCGANYRCYWDGNDVGGKINICDKCAEEYERLQAWNEMPNISVSGAAVPRPIDAELDAKG